MHSQEEHASYRNKDNGVNWIGIMLIWFSVFCLILLLSAGILQGRIAANLLLFQCLHFFLGVQELLRWRTRGAIMQRHHVVVDLPVELASPEGLELDGVGLEPEGGFLDEVALSGGTPPP